MYEYTYWGSMSNLEVPYIESEPLFDRKPNSPVCNGPISIPILQVGMDKQTAILVVHGLSVVEVKESRQLLPWGSTLQFGIQLARILLSLWRHYEKTVLTNFISFMAVVRKILLIIGSELRAGPSHGDTRLLEECCSHFVVIAEQISRQKKLAKVSVDIMKAQAHMMFTLYVRVLDLH